MDEGQPDDSRVSERITRQKHGSENSFIDDAISNKRKVVNLEEALDILSSVDSSTVVRGNINIHLAVDATVSHSMDRGLEPLQLKAVMSVIINTNSRLTQAIKSKLVKCLIPSSFVPEDVVLSAICFISRKIFASPGPSNLDALLLRWILLIFDYLDGYSKLHKVYGVIFTFIHSEKILPHACHLLFLLTRREDVRFFRVEQLMDIVKKMGRDPALIGLLTCYKVFRPHLVSVKLQCSQKKFFKANDTVWRSTITSIVQKNDHQNDQSGAGSWESKKKQQRLLMQPAKHQRQVIPHIHSMAREHGDEMMNGKNSADGCKEVPFEQVDSFAHFLQVIEKIQCPSQIASSLNDPRLQLFLMCNPDQVTLTRLCLWIQHFFAFGFDRRNPENQEDKNKALLKLLCQFSENVQSLPVVHGFLESFLPYWDGHSYIPVLFSLITCIHPCSYGELQFSILQPLFKLFFTSDIYFKAMCVSTMTKLVKNFIFCMISIQSCHQNVEPIANSSASQEKNQSGPGETHVCESNELAQDNSSRNPEELLVYQDCIQQLMRYLDVVIVMAMRMEKDHILLQHVTLDMLEMISNIFKTYKIPVLCLPIRIMHRLLLSDCPSTTARLCGVVNLFRENLTSLKSDNMLPEDKSDKQRVSFTSSIGSVCLDSTLNNADIVVFNSLLIDLLKMLWHGTIFTPSKTLQHKSIFQFPLPKSLKGQVDSKCLTVYKGPAFIGLAYKFLSEIDFQGTKFQLSIIENFKELYLEFLERENFPQFKEFVNLNLKSRRASKD